jgi:hypothetical protein
MHARILAFGSQPMRADVEDLLSLRVVFYTVANHLREHVALRPDYGDPGWLKTRDEERGRLEHHRQLLTARCADVETRIADELATGKVAGPTWRPTVLSVRARLGRL